MPTVAPVLAPYVASLSVYDLAGEAGVHIGMPSTSLTLVLPLGEPIDVGWAGRPESRGRFWANLSGLHAGPAEIHHGPRQRGVYLDLTTAGARALLGVPAGELAGHLLDADDVDPALRDLPERLADAAPASYAEVVTRALVAALARHDLPGPRSEVGRALAGLTRGRRVADVAADVGYSRRHLGELVRAESGVTPKEYQRLARFERSHALVRDGVVLAEVATRCGYADQSHLTREWVALAGCSPHRVAAPRAPIRPRRPGPGAATVGRMTETKQIHHWQTMSFRDADAMTTWLAAIGFTEHATYRDERDPTVVVHAEWVWDGGGGVMFGSATEGGLIDNDGRSAAYLVTDDPDGLFARAVAAGASVVREMVDQDYGGRGGTVLDPEGNLWSFGSYQPSSQQ